MRITPANYLYACGWLYLRADRVLRAAIGHNRWVAVEVAEIQSVSAWQSVVVRGACYATSPTGFAAGDAAMAEGAALLRATVPEMSPEGKGFRSPPRSFACTRTRSRATAPHSRPRRGIPARP